ncbi:hypothetical protein DSO57_1011172 [Entomophthora muscae]|uniref:Uncharacterized protein n=1 Tax=Entomophthora muscae TaxID=34485 RepID=A0ACC2TH10_9FUNG|nr:hypothetical protein DSO57_1011172 [Entomophthora muscae]
MTIEEGRRSHRISARISEKNISTAGIKDDLPVKIIGPKKSKITTAPEMIEGEEPESEQLEILDEDPLDYTADNNILPVRTLEDFYFYDAMSSNKLVSLDEVGADNRDVCGIGKVKASSEETEYFDNGEDDENEDDDNIPDEATKEAAAEELSQVVRLSSIFYWEIKYTPCGSSLIWIRTTYAWYKLLYPNPEYARFYINILKRTRLANIVVNSMTNNPNITYDEFLRDLPVISEQCAAFPNSPPIRIRSIDLLRYIPYIKDEVEAHVQANDAFELLSVPLFEKLMGTPDDEFALPESRPRQRSQRSDRRATSSNEDKTTPPVFTPTISKLASGFIQYTGALDGPKKKSPKEKSKNKKSIRRSFKKHFSRILTLGVHPRRSSHGKVALSSQSTTRRSMIRPPLVVSLSKQETTLWCQILLLVPIVLLGFVICFKMKMVLKKSLGALSSLDAIL